MHVPQYIYKHYRSSEFLGNLQNVISSFKLNTQINSAMAQLDVELALAFPDANTEIIGDLLVTETGDYIVTETGDNILLNEQVSTGTIPAVNDRIEVWEFNEYHPNGVQKYEGIVSEWSSDFKKATTKITLLSLGVRLDNFLVQIFPNTTLAEQVTSNASQTLYSPFKDAQNRIVGAAQTFTPGSSADITGVYVNLANSGASAVNVSLAVVLGTPSSPGATLASTTRSIPVQSEASTLFAFSAPVSLTSGTTYHFKILNEAFGATETNTVGVGYNSAGGYASGQMHTYNDSSGWSSTSFDMAFRIVSSSGGIGNSYASYDPSDIFRDLMDNFAALGGGVSYSAATVENTNTTVSYTFKFNRYLEAVKKTAELAPANWWWWVDPATSLAYFKSLGTVHDHKFILGKHIENLVVKYSLEHLINTVYYTGGDTGGGTNLLVEHTDADSVENYGTWLETPTDNRVTDTTTAELLAQSLVDQHKTPRFSVDLFIPAVLYDLSTVKVGHVVACANTKSLLDNILLQIMATNETPDGMALTLAILPPTLTKRVEDIKRNLNLEQTKDNPNT